MNRPKKIETFVRLALLIWLCGTPVRAQDRTEYFEQIYCWFPRGGYFGWRPVGQHPLTREVALAHPWTYCLESWKGDRYRVTVHHKGNHFEPYLELEATDKPVFKVHFKSYVQGKLDSEQTWKELPSLKKSLRRMQLERPYAPGQGFAEWDAQGRAVRVVSDVDEAGCQEIEEIRYSNDGIESTSRKVSFANNQPVKQHDEVFIFYMKFDREGRWILKEYRDVNNRLVTYSRRQPVARVTRSVEDGGKRIELRNFDAQGKPCLDCEGVFRTVYTRKDHWSEATESRYDLTGKSLPVP